MQRDLDQVYKILREGEQGEAYVLTGAILAKLELGSELLNAVTEEGQLSFSHGYTLEINHDDKKVVLKGNVEALFWNNVDAEGAFSLDGWALILHPQAMPPDAWKLSDSFFAADGLFFDKIDMAPPALHFEQKKGKRFEKGIIQARMPQLGLDPGAIHVNPTFDAFALRWEPGKTGQISWLEGVKVAEIKIQMEKPEDSGYASGAFSTALIIPEKGRFTTPLTFKLVAELPAPDPWITVKIPEAIEFDKDKLEHLAAYLDPSASYTAFLKEVLVNVEGFKVEIFEVRIDLVDMDFDGMAIQVSSRKDWTIVNNLKVQNLLFYLDVRRPYGSGARSFALKIGGELVLGQSTLGIFVEKTHDAPTWSLKLAEDKPAKLPKLNDFLALFGVEENIFENWPDLVNPVKWPTDKLSLSDLEVQFVATGENKGITLVKFSLLVELDVEIIGPIFTVREFYLRVAIERPADTGRSLAATIGTKVEVLKVPIALDASVPKFKFEGYLVKSEVPDLHALIKKLMNDPAFDVPDVVPNFKLTDGRVTYTPSDKEFEVKVQGEGSWKVGDDFELNITKAAFTFKRDPTNTTCSIEVEGNCTLHEDFVVKKFAPKLSYNKNKKQWKAEGTLEVLIMKEITQTFNVDYTHEPESQKLNLTYESSKFNIIDIKDLLTFEVAKIVIEIELKKKTKKQALVANGGTERSWNVSATTNLKVFNPLSPEVPVFSIEKGTLKLFSKPAKYGFEYTAKNAKIYPLMIFGEAVDEKIRKALELGLTKLSVTKKSGKNGQAGWEATIVAEVGLGEAFISKADPHVVKFLKNTFQSVPPGNLIKLKGELTFAPNKFSGTVKNEVGIVIPNLFDALKKKPADTPLVDIGRSYFLLEQVKLEIDGTKPEKSYSPTIEVVLAYGLPEKLNDVLFKQGTPFHGLLNTWKPGNSKTYQRFYVKLSKDKLTGGIKEFNLFDEKVLERLAKPIREGIKIGTDNKHVTLNFDKLAGRPNKQDYGILRIDIPTFNVNLKVGTFQATGGYLIESDSLMIPFSPLKALFDAVGLEAVGKVVPKGIPIQSIEFFPEIHGGPQRKLKLERMEEWLKKMLPEEVAKTFSLPPAFRHFAENELGSVLNRLPDRFKGYLNLYLPKGVKVEIDITSDGSPSLSLEVVEETNTLSGQESMVDFLQLLIPHPSTPGILYGIRLRKFGFGTFFSNSCFRVDLSAEVDVFDLVTLASAMLLPRHSELEGHPNEETLKLIVPQAEKFQRTLIVKDSLTLVFIIKGIPVPVPIFHDDFQLINHSLEGVQAEYRSQFNLGSRSMLAVLMEVATLGYSLYGIIRDGDKYIKIKDYPYKPLPGADSSGLKFGAGPVYFQLPGYLGYEEVEETLAETTGQIGTKKVPIKVGFDGPYNFTFADLFGLGANTLKGLLTNSRVTVPQNDPPIDEKAINYAVQYLPLEHRYGVRDKIKLLFFIDMDFAWAFATPDEFREVVYPRMLKKYAEAGKAVPNQTTPAQKLLELIAQEEDIDVPPGEDQGVVLFLRGGASIGGDMIVLEGAIGMSLTEHQGLRTGIALRGKLFDWVETETLFFLKINAQNQKEPFLILGDTFLNVFGREVLKGSVIIGKDGAAFIARLDAFPPGSPFQLKGLAEGRISAKEFYLHANAFLQLDALRAAFKATIHINQELREADVEMAFANSHLHVGIKAEAGNTGGTLSGSLDAVAFNVLTFKGTFALTLEPKRLALTGYTLLTLSGKGLDKLLHLEMKYAGDLDADKGFIGLQAQITEKSFFLTPTCKVRGGAAFFAWFSGEHAGDFVLSVGGYHPFFRAPSHYPRLPRLSVYWDHDAHTRIRGEAYFALTPIAVMGGARLDLAYEYGSVGAWLKASVDFLVQWKPFYYSVDVSAAAGAFLRIGNRVISVNVEGSLKLWGDKDGDGGAVTINVWFLSYSMTFGTPNRGPQPVETWAEFVKLFLSEPTEVLKLNADAGVKAVNDNGAWIVEPDTFSVTCLSSVPAGDINIRPLRRTGVTSTLTLTLKDKDGKEKTLALRPLKSNLPAALWGKPDADPLNSKNALVKDAVTGYTAPPLKPQKGTEISIFVERLGPVKHDGQLGAGGHEPRPTYDDRVDLGALQTKINQTETDRQATFEEIQQLGLFFPEGQGFINDSLESLTGDMVTEWRETPRILEKQ